MDRERQILKYIKQNLPLFCKEVVYVDRLQAGKREFEGRWIQMGQAGTPDLYALIKHKGGSVLFIECKTLKGRQSTDQKIFQQRIFGWLNVHYLVAHNLNEVLEYIKNNILTK